MKAGSKTLAGRLSKGLDMVKQASKNKKGCQSWSIVSDFCCLGCCWTCCWTHSVSVQAAGDQRRLVLLIMFVICVGHLATKYIFVLWTLTDER
uniref:Uncharacterized protein n=1 Tax=Arundo donax TaxID=35708 RepID=A0A0A8YGR6_ARUDO